MRRLIFVVAGAGGAGSDELLVDLDSRLGLALKVAVLIGPIRRGHSASE
jgi:hypothetical protein